MKRGCHNSRFPLMARHFPQFALSCPCCTPSPRIPFARKSSSAIGCVQDLQPMQVHLYLRLGRTQGYRIGDRTSHPACAVLKQATRVRLLTTGRVRQHPEHRCWRPIAASSGPSCAPDCTASGIKLTCVGSIMVAITMSRPGQSKRAASISVVLSYRRWTLCQWETGSRAQMYNDVQGRASGRDG